MNTTFDTIENLALAQIQDYKLITLYAKTHSSTEPELPITVWQEYVDNMLIAATGDASVYVLDMWVDIEAREFTRELTNIEQNILAKYFCVAWLTREINNAAELNARVQLSGSYTMKNEIREKQNRLAEMHEQLTNLIIQYELQGDGLDDI